MLFIRESHGYFWGEGSAWKRQSTAVCILCVCWSTRENTGQSVSSPYEIATGEMTARAGREQQSSAPATGTLRVAGSATSPEGRSPSPAFRVSSQYPGFWGYRTSALSRSGPARSFPHSLLRNQFKTNSIRVRPWGPIAEVYSRHSAVESRVPRRVMPHTSRGSCMEAHGKPSRIASAQSLRTTGRSSDVPEAGLR